jgi:hypothetical protein
MTGLQSNVTRSPGERAASEFHRRLERLKNVTHDAMWRGHVVTWLTWPAPSLQVHASPSSSSPPPTLAPSLPFGARLCERARSGRRSNLACTADAPVYPRPHPSCVAPAVCVSTAISSWRSRCVRPKPVPTPNSTFYAFALLRFPGSPPPLALSFGGTHARQRRFLCPCPTEPLCPPYSPCSRPPPFSRPIPAPVLMIHAHPRPHDLCPPRDQ